MALIGMIWAGCPADRVQKDGRNGSGSLVMVLVILSEADPRGRDPVTRQAERVRPSSLSILFIKFVREHGQSPLPRSGAVDFHGVATTKERVWASSPDLRDPILRGSSSARWRRKDFADLRKGQRARPRLFWGSSFGSFFLSMAKRRSSAFCSGSGSFS
ncbi:MAG: hypothetical protein MZU91_11785 [Desulfosudis oleivorans]|nr:hypothetical protein [Desulfosudis oleivorans]